MKELLHKISEIENNIAKAKLALDSAIQSCLNQTYCTKHLFCRLREGLCDECQLDQLFQVENDHIDHDPLCDVQ